MGAASTFFSAYNIGMNAFGGVNKTVENNRELMYQANKTETLAAYREIQAGEALKEGEAEAEAHKRATRGALGQMRANYGASGVKVNEGTPVEVMADFAAWRDYEKQRIEYEAARKSWGLNYEAGALRTDAYNLRASKSSVAGSAFGALLGSGTQLFNLYQSTK